ncbi:MAG: hypothetical protein KAS80_05840 [Anaerolineales bacterium]|nr:hypothetical protein [Anaerolineales bacterium]
MDKDTTIGRVTNPEGDFSRQWDFQGRSGVAVRTEVSAQTGTTDVTPLLAGVLGSMALASRIPAALRDLMKQGSNRLGIGGALIAEGVGTWPCEFTELC